MLTTLYKLQKLEAEETALLATQKNSAEYRQVRELKAEFERQQREFLQRQEQLTALKQDVQALAQEQAEAAARLEKEQTAIYDGSIANIRELNARQAQISTLIEKSGALTAELAQKQAELQQGLRQAKQLKQSATEQYQQLSQCYQQYETLRQGWQGELSALAADKQVLLEQARAEDLAWYEAQKPLFAGLPVARLDANHVCDGCRTMVTPILYKRTVLGERTRCEKCGRYLFVEDNG